MPDSEKRVCQNCKAEFKIEPEDFKFYEKIKVPPPTFCPECREQRRIAFRNERALYYRKCDLCGENVVSRVSPDKSYKMYCRKCWWSDKWDSLTYAQEYDFSRPFFEQFKELLFATPHISLLSSNTVNSEWVNQETDDKNCYLNVGGHFNEDSAYNTYELYGKDNFDNYWLLHSELCYGNLNCDRCYRALFSRECFDCIDTILSSDCRNCMNIFGCAELRNQQYRIFNKRVTKEEYQDFLKNNPLTSYKKLSALREKAQEVWLSVPHRDAFIVKCTDCSGNFINESRRAKNAWNAERVEDSKNLYIVGYVKDCYDLTSFGGCELVYEGAHSGGLYNSKFVLYNMGGDVFKPSGASYLEYCYSAITSNNCFGCANLRNKEYCILNKQYTKEEYEKLVPKIVEHMNGMPYVDKKGRAYKYGEFFPIEFSPFGYNETAAQDWYPLTKEEAAEKGYPWSDYESQSQYEFSDYEIPDDITEVQDDVLEKVLKCEVSGKAYRIIPMELQFLRRMGLPIPRRSPLQRHKDRISKLLPRRLYKRNCQCAGEVDDNKIYKNTAKHFHGEKHCPNTIQTPYEANRPEVVYCEKCYLAEVV